MTRIAPKGPTVVARPWGSYEDVHRTREATLKILVVHEGRRMSLQRHQERMEVWRVLQGRGEDQGTTPPTDLLPGATHVVQTGQVHRLANVGTGDLVVVELQLGTCREEDIERLADDFGR